MVEAAWAYRNAAAVSPVIARRQTALPKTVIDIAWKAQLRLCARFRKLAARGLNRNKIVVAIARELAGFVWAIARQVPGQTALSRAQTHLETTPSFSKEIRTPNFMPLTR